jgi:misacylated tRNA(Ala) deacylase
MSGTRILCREDGGTLAFEARVVRVDGPVVTLDQTAFYPTGGGQPCDLGVLELDGRAYAVAEVRHGPDGAVEHVLAEPPPASAARAAGRVDGERREGHRRLHSALHLLTAVVGARFETARVTGGQINSDGTARMDFDLPPVASPELRALEAPLNQHIREDRPVRTRFVPLAEALQVPGVVRTVNRDIPPSPDGRVRLVEIEGLDLQACGGTHVDSTGRCGAVTIAKVDNKGRNNRRIVLRLA